MHTNRHVYWWPIPRQVSGDDRNDQWRFTPDGTTFHQIDIAADTGDESCWTSIHGLCASLQDALRTVAGYGAAVVTVDMDGGRVRIDTDGTGQGPALAPAPDSEVQAAFDLLLGGSGLPVTTYGPVYTFPTAHPHGAHLCQRVATDLGDLPSLVTERSTSMAGQSRVHRFGVSYSRDIAYQWLTQDEAQRLKRLFTASPALLYLQDDPAALFGPPGQSYVIAGPETFPLSRPVAGLARFHLNWTLARR